MVLYSTHATIHQHSKYLPSLTDSSTRVELNCLYIACCYPHALSPENIFVSTHHLFPKVDLILLALTWVNNPGVCPHLMTGLLPLGSWQLILSYWVATMHARNHRLWLTLTLANSPPLELPLVALLLGNHPLILLHAPRLPVRFLLRLLMSFLLRFLLRSLLRFLSSRLSLLFLQPHPLLFLPITTVHLPLPPSVLLKPILT